jgi:hypothetical protein
MVTIVKKVSDDEVIIESVRFLFTTTRRYVRVDTNLWYNKDLHQEITDHELNTLTDEELIYGKEKI